MSLASSATLAAIAVTTAAALVIGLSWLIARLWCMPRRRIPARGPLDYALAYQPISFSSDGVPLRGWLIPPAPKRDPAATVIVAHGWSGNAADMLPAARVLHAAGFAVALFDARGHGTSGGDGPITIVKFAEDIRACLDCLETRPDVDPGRIGLLGHSIGGSGALLAASVDARVRAVVSCSAFADPRMITADFLRRFHIPLRPFLPLVCRFIERWLGTRMEDIAPKTRISRIEAPLLLLHGTRDRFIPPQHMEILYGAARRERAESRRLANRRHADVTTDARCGEEIVAFFGNHLSRPVPAGADDKKCSVGEPLAPPQVRPPAPPIAR